MPFTLNKMVTFLRVTRMNVNVFYIIYIYGLKSNVCVLKFREANTGVALKKWRDVPPDFAKFHLSGIEKKSVAVVARHLFLHKKTEIFAANRFLSLLWA
jgi:hypothetical protein